MCDFEYEKIGPKGQIRIERHGCVNLYIDATGFCFAKHHIGFDEEIARQRTNVDRITSTNTRSPKVLQRLWMWVVGKTIGRA